VELFVRLATGEIIAYGLRLPRPTDPAFAIRVVTDVGQLRRLDELGQKFLQTDLTITVTPPPPLSAAALAALADADDALGTFRSAGAQRRQQLQDAIDGVQASGWDGLTAAQRKATTLLVLQALLLVLRLAAALSRRVTDV
jgi:hypothetical protein